MKTQKTLMSVSFICLMLLAFTRNDLSAQTTERIVSGVVKSLDGPVPYATVMLKGSTIGVSTDINGAFTFPQKLKENDVLLVSFLGYKDDTIVIKKDTTEISPFLEDIPLIIVASLRTAPSKTAEETPLD